MSRPMTKCRRLRRFIGFMRLVSSVRYRVENMELEAGPWTATGIGRVLAYIELITRTLGERMTGEPC